MNEVINKQDSPKGKLTSISPRQALAYLQEDAAIVDIRPEMVNSIIKAVK